MKPWSVHAARALLFALTFCAGGNGWGAAGVERATDWWSFKPLASPTVPAVTNSVSFVRNPIDAFVIAKLDEQGLRPSSEADPRTLIRRLYFDLIGLPPRPEAIEAFVRECALSASSTSQPAPVNAAYDRLVDRLLASPQYGERWARHWLDVVHYGDTHGYDKDQPRPNAWPYRDYVIRAFNADKPYARFVQEQVAGDALFPGTRDGIEALGFIAAGPWDLIGHAEVPETKIDGQIARHLDRDDMVVNTMQTFTSLTVGCAQCHNHKFDPISQEDYYSLQAVFAALDRADRKYFDNPALTQRFDELAQRQRQLEARKKSLDEAVKKIAGQELKDLDQRIEETTKKADGNSRPEYGFHSAIAARQDDAKWVQVDLGRRVSIDRVVLFPCFDSFNNIGGGFGFPVRFKVEAGDDPEFKTNPRTIAARFDNDVKNPGTAPQTFAGADATARYVRVTATKLAPRQNDFIFALAELQVFDPAGRNVATNVAVTALDSIEAPPRWRKENLVDSIVPAPDRSGELAELKLQRTALLDRSADADTRRQLGDVKKNLEATGAELGKLPKPNAVYAGTVHHGSGAFAGTGANGGQPRTIHVLNRGDVRQPRAVAVPGALSAITALPARFTVAPEEPEGARRAALARWLTDAQHPQTWRSLVNRVWHYHFGRGLVETANDFGHNGARPTHPELLDWLACEFRDHGGSLKQLHRLIVTSATYRQASSAVGDQYSVISGIGSSTPRGPEKLNTDYIRRATAIDADNRFLWRMNRRKLEAEAMRDAVLFVSGRLDLKMGGPAFQDFVVEKPEHSPHYEYGLHDPDDPRSHRRSIYRFIVRSQLQPFMTTLDCADPSIQVARRNQSLSPLQALALLNDGFMLTMSRHFAGKLETSDDDLAAQIARGFREALGRSPTTQEAEALVSYAQRHGLANVCRVLFNLNEFTFVD